MQQEDANTQRSISFIKIPILHCIHTQFYVLRKQFIRRHKYKLIPSFLYFHWKLNSRTSPSLCHFFYFHSRPGVLRSPISYCWQTLIHLDINEINDIYFINTLVIDIITNLPMCMCLNVHLNSKGQNVLLHWLNPLNLYVINNKYIHSFNEHWTPTPTIKVLDGKKWQPRLWESKWWIKKCDVFWCHHVSWVETFNNVCVCANQIQTIRSLSSMHRTRIIIWIEYSSKERHSILVLVFFSLIHRHY